MWGNALIDAANKPDRGPVQPGWASTDLRHRPAGPDQCPNSGSSGAEDAPYPGNGGSGPPFLLDRPHPSDLERAVAEAPVARRRRAAAHPRARLPAARPRCTRRSRSLYHGDEAAAGGAVGGADDDPKGQTLVVGGSWPLSSCCWSSPGPSAGSGPPARRPRHRRNGAAVNAPGEWARRSPSYGPPRATLGIAACGRTGGAVAAWAERSRV